MKIKITKDKLIRGVLTGTAVFAVALAGFTGWQVSRLWPVYDGLRGFKVSQEEIDRLLEDKKAAQSQLSAEKKKLEVITDRCAALETAAGDGGSEELIRQAYEKREKAAAGAEALILSQLEDMKLVTFETSGFNENFIDGLIDETGNEILSGGIKSAIEAASEEMSIESILNGVKNGAVSGIGSYVESGVKDYISDKIGGDIFSAAGLINDLVNAENTPHVLANGIAKEQEELTQKLLELLGEETTTAGKLQNEAAVVYGLISLQEETSAITGDGGTEDKDEVCAQLTELARQYGQSDYQILKYAERKGENSHEE